MRIKTIKSMAFTFVAAFLTSLAVSGTANAAGNNPFAVSDNTKGVTQLAEMKDGKCGEGKCGGMKGKKEMKDGKCGNMQKSKGMKDGKCGEGKCGGMKGKKEMKSSDMQKSKGMKDGKCGEGKCGGMKK